MRFWVSWVQRTDDYRPLGYPPKGLLGWWCSGYDCDDNATLCALLDADTEDAAKAAIAKEWPETEGIEWRFWNVVADDYFPGNRFPLPDWSPLLATEE